MMQYKRCFILIIQLLCLSTASFLKASEERLLTEFIDPEKTTRMIRSFIDNYQQQQNPASILRQIRSDSLASLGLTENDIETRPIIELLTLYGANVRKQRIDQNAISSNKKIIYNFEKDGYDAIAFGKIQQGAKTGAANPGDCHFCKFAQDSQNDGPNLIVATFTCGNDCIKILLNLYSYTVVNLVILTNHHAIFFEDLPEQLRNMFMEALALSVRILRSLNIFDRIYLGWNIVSEVAGGSVRGHVHANIVGIIDKSFTLDAAEVAFAINVARKYPDIYNLLKDKFKTITLFSPISVDQAQENVYADQPECNICRENPYVLKQGTHWKVVVSLHPCKTGTLDIVSLKEGVWFDELSKEAWHELGNFMVCCMSVLKKELGAQGFNAGLTSGYKKVSPNKQIHRHLFLRLVLRKRADSQFLDACNDHKVITQRSLNTWLKLISAFKAIDQSAQNAS